MKLRETILYKQKESCPHCKAQRTITYVERQLPVFSNATVCGGQISGCRSFVPFVVGFCGRCKKNPKAKYE